MYACVRVCMPRSSVCIQTCMCASVIECALPTKYLFVLANPSLSLYARARARVCVCVCVCVRACVEVDE